MKNKLFSGMAAGRKLAGAAIAAGAAYFDHLVVTC
jgi:hypothetical protein